MTQPSGHSELLMRVTLIVSTIVAVAAFIVVATQPRSAAPPPQPPDTSGYVMTTDASIASEAPVFRTHPAMFAIAPASSRERPAHPRTLATYRTLREYPGAPPRIPHGFTADEFRTGACKTCHERGGYSPRFGAYVPVTPHPEMTACLQCHVGNDAVTGVSLPSFDPNQRCRQCHTFDGSRGATPGLDWRTSGWPTLAKRTADSLPPVIPHDLDFRGNCLACHSGPAAVAELRTAHPDRTNCRQCHVLPTDVPATYVRPSPAGSQGGVQ